MTDFAVVDLETTGLSPDKNHRIIEIGVVLTDGSNGIDYEWSTLVNPHRDLGPTAIHEVTGRMLRDAPSFADVSGDLSLLLNHRVLVAHNAQFDVGFLEAEWHRLGLNWTFESLCTMQLARNRGLPGKLSHCCDALGVTNAEAHHALGDARAAAELLAILQPTLSELPRAVQIPPIIPTWSGLSYPRSNVPRSVESDFIAALVDRLPDAGAHGVDAPEGAAEAYRDVLDRTIEDCVLTEDEINELVSVARSWGIDAEQAALLHESYLTALIGLAAADGSVSKAELNDLRRVGELLGVGHDVLDRLVAEAVRMIGKNSGRPAHQQRREVENEFTGMSVCFTGTSTCSIDGVLLSREAQGMLAAAHGLTSLPRVTKKLDILVVADPDSESGKARKAREYGTRIIAERAFWEHLNLAVN